MARRTRGQLLTDKLTMERRLQKGYDEIGKAETEGRDSEANRYFAVWHTLLKEYEATCDELRAREGR